MKSLFKKFILPIVISTLTLTSCAPSNAVGDEISILKVVNTTEINYNSIETPWKNQSLATMLMYRTFFDTDIANNTLSNNLIKPFEMSDDNVTYKFELKDDIIWSDGETINVDDFIFSIKALLLTEQVNTIYKTTLSNIIGAEEFIKQNDMNNEIESLIYNEDDRTFQFTLETPINNMLEILAQIAILPKHCFEDADIYKMHEDDYWKNPVTSGMMVVKEILPDEYIHLSRNPYRTYNVTSIDEIMIYADKNQTELDLYLTNNIDDIFDFRSDTNMKEYSIDSLFYRYFVFNIDKGGELDPVLSDVRFREAITYAIDREMLLSKIYLNAGYIVDSAILPIDEAYIKRDISYNPEKSKELLADMNYDFNRPIKLFYYYKDDTSKKFIDIIKAELEDIGLTVEVIEPNDISLLTFDDYDICLKGLSAFDYSEWFTEYHSLSPTNINLFGGDDSFNDLLSRLSSTHDDEEKIQIFQELQMLEFEKSYKIPLFTLSQMIYVNESRLNLPDKFQFGNFSYKYDWYFDEWEIK